MADSSDEAALGRLLMRFLAWGETEMSAADWAEVKAQLRHFLHEETKRKADRTAEVHAELWVRERIGPDPSSATGGE